MDACEPSKPAAPDDCGDGDRAVELIGRVYGELETLRAENEALKREIAELKKQRAGSAATAKVAEPYSMRAEEKRQRARGRGKRQ